MIYVKIELWPHGSPVNKKVIGIAVIANDGSGTDKRGNYSAVFMGKTRRSIRGITVRNFPRKSYTAWKLLYLALKQVFGEKK